MGLKIYQVDAFTDAKFKGNPACVCILSKPADEQWMQNVAMEMNLSETAFLHKQLNAYNLRWFTPALEVDLCGHATLASSHVLWEIGKVKPNEMIRFSTKSGQLTAQKKKDIIEMDFPATPVSDSDSEPDVVKALHVIPRYFGKTRFDCFIELETEKEVRALNPDFKTLKELGVRGVIVTARATTKGFDFVSRFFAPGSGINEDPVTGSAHCALGPYWQNKFKKNEFIAYQASKRGGIIHVRVGDKRVFIGGKAVTMMTGELL